MEMSRVCPQTGAPMHRGIKAMTIAFKGEETTIDMPGWYCAESDESIHNGTDMKISDQALAELKARVQA